MVDPSGKTVAALEAAVAAVKAAKVPKDLRVAAFNAAFYGPGGASTPSAASGSGGSKPPSAPPPSSGGQSEGVAKIAAKLELDEGVAGQVFDVDEDGVHLTVKRDGLSSTNKFAQQEVTYLVVAGRQALGLEEWTLTKTILAAAHDRGVHDTNMSKAVGALDGDGLRFRGPKTKREMKMNAVGFSKATEIVKRLTEAS